jgi:hypothetical protein
MPRAISMRHTIVPSAEREEFRIKSRDTRDHYTGAGCRYWLYEEDALPGAYVEFYEASDRETLVKAHESRPEQAQLASRLYVEVDLN